MENHNLYTVKILLFPYIIVYNMEGKSIYSRSSWEESRLASAYYRSNRINLINDEISKDFNTYKNWTPFAMAMPKVWNENEKGEIVISDKEQPWTYGVKSLFSNVSAVYGRNPNTNEDNIPLRMDVNAPLLDTAEIRRRIREKTDCTVKALVKSSENGEMGRAIYNYGDFMYCKYLGKVPNNYLITLRKFPLPCGDHINHSSVSEGENGMNKHLPDMGRLVTWLGTPGNEMSNILKYSYKIPWQVNNAPFDQEVSSADIGAEGGGMLGQFVSTIDGTFGRQVANTNGGFVEKNWIANRMGVSGTSTLMNPDLKDSNRIVADRQNVIAKVMVPGGKEGGLELSQDISLIFDYELRSYDGINGRSAMLDLIGNILMVTYLQGQFFPGSYRSAFMAQSNLYSSLDIFKNPGSTKSPMAFMDSLFTSANSLAAGFKQQYGDVKSALKSIAGNLFSVLANGMLNKLGRPQQFALTSFITPTATGNWHLTIGNPKNPILSIGNLILTDASIEHYGPLGLDDFPTGLRVTVKLEHARPRDSVAIEQMYMHGNSRIYTPMGSQIEQMYNAGVKERTLKNSLDDIDSKQSAASIKTTSPISSDSKSLYMKYFGTTNMQGIMLDAKEALTGADSKKSKESANKSK